MLVTPPAPPALQPLPFAALCRPVRPVRYSVWLNQPGPHRICRVKSGQSGQIGQSGGKMAGKSMPHCWALRPTPFVLTPRAPMALAPPQVDNVKKIMTDNVSAMLERGDKLDRIGERTDDLVAEVRRPGARASDRRPRGVLESCHGRGAMWGCVGVGVIIVGEKMDDLVAEVHRFWAQGVRVQAHQRHPAAQGGSLGGRGAVQPQGTARMEVRLEGCGGHNAEQEGSVGQPTAKGPGNSPHGREGVCVCVER